MHWMSALWGQPTSYTADPTEYSSIADGRYQELASRAIVVVAPGGGDPRDLKGLLGWFSEATAAGRAGGRVVIVPHDPHIALGERLALAELQPATRVAFLRVAEMVVDNFSLPKLAWRPTAAQTAGTLLTEALTNAALAAPEGRATAGPWELPAEPATSPSGLANSTSDRVVTDRAEPTCAAAAVDGRESEISPARAGDLGTSARAAAVGSDLIAPRAPASAHAAPAKAGVDAASRPMTPGGGVASAARLAMGLTTGNDAPTAATPAAAAGSAPARPVRGAAAVARDARFAMGLDLGAVLYTVHAEGERCTGCSDPDCTWPQLPTGPARP